MVSLFHSVYIATVYWMDKDMDDLAGSVLTDRLHSITHRAMLRSINCVVFTLHIPNVSMELNKPVSTSGVHNPHSSSGVEFVLLD